MRPTFDGMRSALVALSRGNEMCTLVDFVLHESCTAALNHYFDLPCQTYQVSDISSRGLFSQLCVYVP
jgi:hypothetical protein